MAASSLQMTRREDGSYLFDFVNHSQQVLFTLNECRQFANLCDCSVVVEGQVFYAHKGVLVSCSDYFKEIFTTQQVNARQSIDLINIKVAGFQLFIEFAYMARMAISMQDVDTVLNTAVTLKSATMLEACCEFLKSQLTGDNCVDIISIAEAYNLTEIKRQANRLMCERLIELSQTYKKGQFMPDGKEDFEALTARFAAQTAQQVQQAQLPVASAAQMAAPLMTSQQSLVAAQAQAILEATNKLDAAAAAVAAKLDPSVAAKLEDQSASTGTDDDDDDPGGPDSESSDEEPQDEEAALLAQLPPASTLPKPILRLQNKGSPVTSMTSGDRTLKVETKAALKSPIVTRSRGRPTRGRPKAADLNLRPRRNLRIQRALRIKKGAIALPRMKKDYFCKICNIPFGKLRDLRNHTTEQHHKCTKCNRYFRQPHELESHLLVHQNRSLQQKGPKRYQCTYCGKQCGYSSALKIHVRTHTGEKPYQCDLCDQRFIQSINLKRHVLTNHSKETPYQCKFCNKKFSVYVYLKSHEITHSDHRPFQCEACGAMFKRKSDLRSHNRVHSTEKPFTCDLCQAKFKSPNDLKTHTLIHNDRKPHTCDKCGAAFKRTGHLNRHMMIHTNAKPFQCETCGAQFNRKENLRSHQRIHSGEQPYKCNVCGASFRHLSSLKMHEKNHWSDRTSQDTAPNVATHDPTPTLQHIAALMGLQGLGTPQQQASLAAAVTIAGTATSLPINTSTPTPVMTTQQVQRDLIQVPLHPIQVKIYPNSNGNTLPTSPNPVASPTGRTHMASPPPAHMASALMGLQGLANQQQTIPVAVTLTGAGTPPPHSVTPTPIMTAQQLQQRNEIKIPLHQLQVQVYPNTDVNAATSTQSLAIASTAQRVHMTSPPPAHLGSGMVQPIHVGSTLPQNLQVQSPAPQGITTTQIPDQAVTFMSM